MTENEAPMEAENEDSPNTDDPDGIYARLEELESETRKLHAANEKTTWALYWQIGDACRELEKHGQMKDYAETIEDIISYSRVRVCKAVADAFPEAAKRDAALSFGHYEAVGDRPDRYQLLGQAKRNKWSKHQLEAKVRERRDSENAPRGAQSQDGATSDEPTSDTDPGVEASESDENAFSEALDGNVSDETLSNPDIPQTVPRAATDDDVLGLVLTQIDHHADALIARLESVNRESVTIRPRIAETIKTLRQLIKTLEGLK